MTKPSYELFDDMQKGRISRRDFLRRSAAAGAATPLIVGYLDRGSAAAAPATRLLLTPSLSQAGPLQPPAEGADTSDALVFRGWDYNVPIVQDNVAKFNEQYKENVDYQTVAGDYISIMENFHISNQKLDLAYANPATVYRWSVPGWIVDFERFWSVDDARGEMYDGVRASLSVAGKLYGLPYFVSIRGTMMANNVLLEKAGITPDKYPKTWAELYDQARQMKKDKVAEFPLLPHWFTGGGAWYGISWAYLFECLNTGAKLFDDANKPVFDDASLKILTNWRKLVEEKIIPEQVITMVQQEFIDSFAGGNYAYSPQQTYDLKTFNDPQTSKIPGKVAIVPVVDQPWGLIDEGIYTVSNRNQSEDRLQRDYRLGGFFGYRDKAGDLFVAKRWAIESALNSGYKAVLDDPEVVAAYNKWLPDPAMRETIRNVVDKGQFPKVWQTFWWEEFNAQMITELPKAVLGQTPVEEVHANLKKLATELAERYSA